MYRIKEEEVEELKEFIEMLNHASSKGALVVVEGKRDVMALTNLGFSGSIITLNASLSKIASKITSSIERREVILLLDMDSKGRYLTKRLASMIPARKVNLFYKKRLLEVTRGRIRRIEELTIYKEYMNRYGSTYLNLSSMYSRIYSAIAGDDVNPGDSIPRRCMKLSGYSSITKSGSSLLP